MIVSFARQMEAENETGRMIDGQSCSGPAERRESANLESCLCPSGLTLLKVPFSKCVRICASSTPSEEAVFARFEGAPAAPLPGPRLSDDEVLFEACHAIICDSTSFPHSTI